MRILTDNGRMAGNFDPIDRTFTRKVHGSRHMLHEPPAWAMDESVFDTLDKLSCEFIQVIDMESGKVFEIDLETFREKSIKIDRGCGPQLALPLTYWKLKESETYF